MVRPMVTSEKHYVQVTLSTVLVGTNLTIPIAVAEASPTPGDGREINIGTTVKAVYVEMWYQGPANQPTTISTAFIKISNGGSGPSTADMIDIHNYQSSRLFCQHI